MNPTTQLEQAAMEAAKEYFDAESNRGSRFMQHCILRHIKPLVERLEGDLIVARALLDSEVSASASTNARIAELTAQVAAKDAALRTVADGHMPTVGQVQAIRDALSPTCAAGWLSPEETKKLRKGHAETKRLLDEYQKKECGHVDEAGTWEKPLVGSAVTDRERSAQIRALEWAKDSLPTLSIYSNICGKLTQLRAGGPLI